MTPSDRTGNPLGDAQVEGRAHESTPPERLQANAVLAQKYGEAFQRIAGTETPQRTYIVVEP